MNEVSGSKNKNETMQGHCGQKCNLIATCIQLDRVRVPLDRTSIPLDRTSIPLDCTFLPFDRTIKWKKGTIQWNGSTIQWNRSTIQWNKNTIQRNASDDKNALLPQCPSIWNAWSIQVLSCLKFKWKRHVLLLYILFTWIFHWVNSRQPRTDTNIEESHTCRTVVSI